MQSEENNQERQVRDVRDGAVAPPQSEHSPQTRMFHCREALQGMYMFIDGEMPADEREVLQHHLEQCSPCLEAFEFEAEVKMVVSQRCKDEVPDAVVMKVTKALMMQIDSDKAGELASPKAQPNESRTGWNTDP